MKIEPQKLKAFLIEMNVVDKKQCEDVFKRAEKNNQNVEEILVREGLIPEKKLLNLKAYILGIPFVDLEDVVIPPEILKIIPEPIARSHNIVAFRKDGKNLEVAMLNPEDLGMIDFVAKKSGLRISSRLTSPEGLKNVLKQYQRTLETEFSNIIKKESRDVSIKGGTTEDPDELRKAAEELPIIKIVDILIRNAALQGASDIHIEPTEKELIIRYRIDGILHDIMMLPVAVKFGVVARIKVLSNLKLDEHRLPQDGRFKIENDKEKYKYSIRVSILPVFGGEKIVMRLLLESAKALTLEQLGFSGRALEMLENNLRRPTGMILVTGPTGSGKTTTLYSMMEILNTPQVNISTVEDPIEYLMPRVNQTQVNPKIGLSFATGLRALVRQDPNIIMVGEIRDEETASLAINAALTGHLVLSTLHTINATGAIPRLIDMKAEPFLISSTLNIVVAQRLVRKLDSKKEEYKLNDASLKNFSKYCDLERVLEVLREEKLAKAKDTLKDIVFYRAKASPESPEGYGGRVGIYEVLNVDQSIKELIVKQATAEQIQERAQKQGMRTMVEDGFIKAAQGITSIEEVLRVIIE